MIIILSFVSGHKDFNKYMDKNKLCKRLMDF